MKSIILLVCVFAFCASLYAQPPQAFNYQGIARDGLGSPLANQNISLRIVILQGALPGTEVYKETHNVHTNMLGLFTIEVGHGTSQIALFENIDWGAGDHYIQIEMDPSGGTDFTKLGESQLLSVPYALYAGNGSGGEGYWQKNQRGIHFNDGHVGIGTNNPQHKLSILGNNPTGDDRYFLNLHNQSTSNRSLVSINLKAGQTSGLTTLQHIADTYNYEGDKFSNFGQFESSGRGLILRASHQQGIIKFLAGGNSLSPAERMRITSRGYIGIGTENPTNLVTIDGNVGTGDERFFLAVNNNSLSNRSFAAAKFTAGAGTSMTTFGHNSETYDADNNGTADFGGIFSSGAGIHFTAGGEKGLIKFMTGRDNVGYATERMRISTEGNLGVGTKNPVTRVQVTDGDVYIEDIDNGVIMKSPNGSCWRLTMNNDGTIKSTSISCPN